MPNEAAQTDPQVPRQNTQNTQKYVSWILNLAKMNPELKKKKTQNFTFQFTSSFCLFSSN